jgi:uncharacterized protein (TIGR03435 family)
MTIVAVAALTLFAQVLAQKPAMTPDFVGSIRKSTSADPPAFRITQGRFSAQNVTARFLIAIAYGVQNFQVAGGAGWVDTEHFDVEARLDDAKADSDREPAMIKALLAERFKLALHPETRESTVYALIVQGNAPNIKASADQTPGGGMTPLGSMNIGASSLVGTGVPLGLFASLLGTRLGRTVIDQTSLAGRYDIDLRWTPDAGDTLPLPDSPGPSIFTAVQEQLGLKLQSTKGQAGFLVIERIEKPSAN